MTTTNRASDESLPAAAQRTPSARQALIDAATQLLPQRAPSAISGRDLAAEAGVNYGLIHHYFGGKDAALHDGLVQLRDDFVRQHGDGADLRLIGISGDPFLRALVRSQVDYPSSVSPVDDFPIGGAIAAAISERLAARSDAGRVGTEHDAAAKARTIAAVSIQVCYSVFGEALLDAVDVGDGERPQVEALLGQLYDDLTLLDD